MRGTLSSTLASTAARIMTATASMLRAHATRPQIQALGPTGERAAKAAEVRAPVKEQHVIREAFELLDPIAKHGERFPPYLVDVLRDYVQDRLAQGTASLAFNTYEPRIDNWRGAGTDGEPADDEEEDPQLRKAAEITRLHRGLPPQMRALADALVDTVGEMQHGRSLDWAIREIVSRSESAHTREGAMRASLYWLAVQLHHLRRN
jgi:hypothetical protein